MLLSSLKSLFKLPGRYFLIIDALDECPTQNDSRYQLCKTLSVLSTIPNLHMITTARKVSDLEESLAENYKLTVIPIHKSQVNSDIILYVKSQLESNPKFRSMKWLSKVKDEIINTLAEGADGM